MASYNVEFRKSAEKELRRISMPHLGRVLRSIEKLSETPFPTGSCKLVGSECTYRIRVGDYRVMYEVIKEYKIIRIEKVRHRRDAYKK